MQKNFFHQSLGACKWKVGVSGTTRAVVATDKTNEKITQSYYYYKKKKKETSERMVLKEV